MYAAAEPRQSQAINPHPGPSHLPNLIPTLAFRPRPIARRPSVEQGHALEVLGHAIEYLVDSRLYLIGEPAARADSAATQLLMLHSRQIFSECAEAVPVSRRVKLWIAERLTCRANC